jgi:hypothetical protein
MSVGGSESDVLVYEAPDRTYDGAPSESGALLFATITIGTNLYYEGGTSEVAWVEQPTLTIAQSAPQNAMLYLEPLLHARIVEGHGDTYTVQFVSPDRLAEANVTATVVDGRITAEGITESDGDKTLHLALSYSKFGMSPPVILPLPSQVTPARKCGNAYFNPVVECGPQ